MYQACIRAAFAASSFLAAALTALAPSWTLAQVAGPPDEPAPLIRAQGFELLDVDGRTLALLSQAGGAPSLVLYNAAGDPLVSLNATMDGQRGVVEVWSGGAPAVRIGACQHDVGVVDIMNPAGITVATMGDNVERGGAVKVFGPNGEDAALVTGIEDGGRMYAYEGSGERAKSLTALVGLDGGSGNFGRLVVIAIIVIAVVAFVVYSSKYQARVERERRAMLEKLAAHDQLLEEKLTHVLTFLEESKGVRGPSDGGELS